MYNITITKSTNMWVTISSLRGRSLTYCNARSRESNVCGLFIVPAFPARKWRRNGVGTPWNDATFTRMKYNEIYVEHYTIQCIIWLNNDIYIISTLSRSTKYLISYTITMIVSDNWLDQPKPNHRSRHSLGTLKKMIKKIDDTFINF